MVGKIGMARGVALAAIAALLLTSGAALAQLNGMNSGSPLLGVPGNTAPTVSGTGIPFGSTELGGGGLSPMPLGATSGLAPFGSSTMGATTMGSGIGAIGTTTLGVAGTMPSLGSGLSPGVMSPMGLLPQTPTQTPAVTNYGVGGMQPLPGNGPSTSALR